MSHVVVIGAGITGVTTVYALLDRGHEVTVLDRHRYPAMETSFANGGQLSACNAEVWNSVATVVKGLRWVFKRDAPLLMKLTPSWHKYSWLGEFVRHITNYRQHTVDTTRLAIEARRHLFAMAERENIDFDLERRGILHIYHDKAGFEAGARVNELLREGGLERYPVAPSEIGKIEPALRGTYHGGFFTPSDCTGDIHKFTRGLSEACIRRGARFVHDAEVSRIESDEGGLRVHWSSSFENGSVRIPSTDAALSADAIVICAGVASRKLAAMIGDRINVYPVKGYSITVALDSDESQRAAPQVSLLDEAAKIVTSRLGQDRFRVAGTAEFNGFNRDIRADRIKPLTDWVRASFPGIDSSKVIPWTGLRPMMPSMMPVVRASRKSGIFYNTGHGHLGWTLSAATAQLVAGMIESSSMLGVSNFVRIRRAVVGSRSPAAKATRRPSSMTQVLRPLRRTPTSQVGPFDHGFPAAIDPIGEFLNTGQQHFALHRRQGRQQVPFQFIGDRGRCCAELASFLRRPQVELPRVLFADRPLDQSALHQLRKQPGCEASLEFCLGDELAERHAGVVVGQPQDTQLAHVQAAPSNVGFVGHLDRTVAQGIQSIR
jgi:D-amino-acid dehydrogenase